MAVATLMDAGYRYWEFDDHSMVRLSDLIEHRVETAPRVSADEAARVAVLGS
jgi:hypothetical protein